MGQFRLTENRLPWDLNEALHSIRRECLDHLIVMGEAHLRRVLKNHAAYYHGLRTHLSLGKDALFRRRVERCGPIIRHPVLGGLHHQYGRMSFR